jgi:glutathione S-transferase
MIWRVSPAPRRKDEHAMKLYAGAISPMSKRVRIAAAEAGVAYEATLLDFAKGEPRMPAYLALNPMGKVPTITEGDFTLWESAAIMCFVARKTGSDILPRDPRAEADTLRWLFFCSCHIDPYFTTLVIERFVKGKDEPEDVALTQNAEHCLARFLPVVESQLASREFLTGRFGLGDIALGCMLELDRLLRVDLTPYPTIRQWLARLQARESWRAASVGSSY